MRPALLVLSAVLLLGGLVLRLLATRHRTALGKSLAWYDVRYWFAPWRNQALLTDKGMQLHSTSLALLMAGVALVTIAEFMLD